MRPFHRVPLFAARGRAVAAVCPVEKLAASSTVFCCPAVFKAGFVGGWYVEKCITLLLV